MSLSLWIVLGVVIIIVARRFSPILGSSLAILFLVGVGAWGALIYSQGGAIALAGYELSATVFFVIIGLWCALEAYGLVTAIRRRAALKREDELTRAQAESGQDGEPPEKLY